MTINRVKWGLAIGMTALSLSFLSGCDQIEQRQKNFKELTEKVRDQVNHDVLGEPTQEDRLAAASVDQRALAGVQQVAPELADVTMDEALRTESYFAVGSVIAKPRVQVAAIVASAELAEEIEAELDAEPVAEAIIEAPAPASSSTPQSARKPMRSLKVAPILEGPAVRELEESVARKLPQSQDLPRLKELRQIRQLPQGALQKLDQMPKAPGGPRIRKVLMEPEANAAKVKMRERLEKMGLPTEIEAGDSGAMRIHVNVGPTSFPLGGPAKLDRLKTRFAPIEIDEPIDCDSPRVQARFSQDAALATECVVEVLEESGEYEYVEKDYIFTHQFERRPKDLPVQPVTDTRVTPNDPLWSLQWHFKDLGEGDDESAGGASFQDFWTRTRQTGSAGVVVAVVDTGLQTEHRDIKTSGNLAPGYDMVSDPFMGNDGDGRDSDPTDPGDACDPSDPNSRDTFHGTHVAGTVGVAATNNADGVAAGAWNVTIVPVRALGRCGGQLSDINDAIRWAAGVVPARDDLGAEIWNANPADIINLSIGLFERCPASMQEAINDATAAGAIVVAAAGNARIDTQYYAPGGCENVISVAAGDGRGQLAYYSNYGAAVDILAPGGDMTRDDDGDGRPDGILSTKLSQDCYDPVTKAEVANCYYAYENGTSMAAPHVSAALALLKSQFPTATATELRARLLAATSPRDQLQCSGKCTHYPGSTPIPGQDGLCYRPCGGAMLNLKKASLE